MRRSRPPFPAPGSFRPGRRAGLPALLKAAMLLGPLGAASAALAQQGREAETLGRLTQCTRIESLTERLACYDAAMQAFGDSPAPPAAAGRAQSRAAPAAIASAAAPSRPAAASLAEPAPRPVSAAPVSAAPVATAPVATAPVATAPDSAAPTASSAPPAPTTQPALAAGGARGFGRESIRSPTRFQTPEGELERLTAKVAEVEQREVGVYVITLEDGAVWQFVGSAGFNYRPPRKGSQVIIDRASLGGFLLRYDRQPGAQVRRLR